MVLYDFVAPAYDPLFESSYLPFRRRAFERLPGLTGARVLDLACGTGQNFPLLAPRIGAQGKIIGVDISTGMLHRARRRSERSGRANVALVQLDATVLSATGLETCAGISTVDAVICSYGFTAMRDWETAFLRSYHLLKPGGSYLVLDLHAKKPTLHSRAVELVTRCDFSHQPWRYLKERCPDFRMDYLDPSTHLFGGRVFVACATKPA